MTVTTASQYTYISYKVQYLNKSHEQEFPDSNRLWKNATCEFH
jgi:hypothetical protein